MQYVFIKWKTGYVLSLLERPVELKPIESLSSKEVITSTDHDAALWSCALADSDEGKSAQKVMTPESPCVTQL